MLSMGLPHAYSAALKLDLRPMDGQDTDASAELERLRASIDNIDAALIYIIAERFKITKEVGQLKAKHGMPPADPAREAAQVKRLRDLAGEARLDADFAEKLLAFIIKEVIRHHEAMRPA
jgi:chorismate mutase